MNDITVLEKESIQLVEEARSREIINQRTYEESALFLTSIKMLKKKIESFFEPTINKFKEAKKKADEGRKAEVERMDVYLRSVIEAQKILQDKCKRYENYCAKKEEEERKEKEEAERKRLEAEAKEAEDWGEEEKAEELKDESKEVEITVAPKVHKVSGLGIQRRWKAKIVDLSKVPIEFLLPDMVALNKLAVQDKENFNVSGVEAINE